MRPCYICNEFSYLGNFIETSGSIVCGYNSSHDGDTYYLVSGIDPLYGITMDTEICNKCLISLCKNRRIKIDESHYDISMGYCDGCDTFQERLKCIMTDKMFPYTDVYHFEYHQEVLGDETIYLFYHGTSENKYIDNGKYCLTCIDTGKSENILRPTHPMYGEKPGYYGIVTIIDDIHKKKEDLEDMIFYLDENGIILHNDIMDRLKHKKYTKEITKRLLLRCWINNVIHPYKEIIFDKNVQEIIFSFL